jgi:hypothetical protein
MKIKNQVIIVLFAFFSVAMYSQEISNQKAYIITQLAQLNSNPNYLIDNNSNSSANNLNSGSVVKLNQLGDYNTIDLKTKLNDSQNVSQLGNKNNYTFINYYNTNPSTMNVLQQGNGNFLQVYGQNNLMSKISIIQKSNFKTITIVNY